MNQSASVIDQLNLTLKMFVQNLTVGQHAYIVHQIDFKCELEHLTSGGSCNALDCSFILYLYNTNMHQIEFIC